MSFIDEINSDMNWRMSELASLKTIPLRYNLLQHHREMLIKYTVPSIYSLWEGFVKCSFELYIREINILNLSIEEVHINILTHMLSSDDKLSLENTRVKFSKKVEFIEYYQNKIKQPINILNKIPTKSNIDFEVISDILMRFNLDPLPVNFKKKLNKLLEFRNSIAHGETSIPVKIDDITFFSDTVSDLMVEILLRINDGYVSQSYKK